MSTDLSERIGLPLASARDGRVIFGGGLPEVTPEARTLEAMRPVLYNQTATEPEELYYMYRGLGRPEDTERFARHNLRFDLTVLVPGLVGGEYVKTAGHYHPAIPGRSETYPELYQVIAGRAHYLLQRPGRDGDGADPGDGKLEEVAIVEAGPGDALYVPPGYGHVTINTGPEPLIMVNVVDSSFASVYEPYRERHGAAYYEIEDRGQNYVVANDHYDHPPEPRLGRPTDLGRLGLSPGVPLYAQLARNPAAFAFLSDPPADGPRP